MELDPRHRLPSLHRLETELADGRQRSAGPAVDLQNQPSGYSNLPPSPRSSISLYSPALAAIRQYCKDNGLQAAATQKYNQSDRRFSSQTSQEFPRRHSILSPGGLATRIGMINVSTPINPSPIHNRRQEVKSLADASRTMLLTGVNSNEMARLGSVVTRRKSVLLPSSGKVPSEYTHEKLRKWGSTYLGNPATADAYVKAVHLRKPEAVGNGKAHQLNSKSESLPELQSDPSLKSHDEQEAKHPHLEKEIVIRARVIPRAKERKPFLIQRRFNLQDMSANATDSKVQVDDDNDGSQTNTVVLSRSEEPETQGMQLRSKSISSKRRRPSESRTAASSYTRVGFPSSDRRIMPIHVEYALHYLPILAALMLSGHVRKGDAIDLPLPQPEVWRETISYIYTGKGEVTGGIKENILYLAGSVE